MHRAKHLAKRNIGLAAVALAACLLAIAAVVLILHTLPDDAPVGAPVSSTPPTTTVTTTEATSTTTTTTTTEVTTTTTRREVVLSITSHKKADITTTEPFTVFAGTSDPAQPLMLNGKEVQRNASGAFSVEIPLERGKNTFTFSHKGKETTYIVRYRYVVMRSYTPTDSQRYKSGATFSVVVSARADSTVTATFRGKTITLKRSTGQGGDEEVVQSDTFVNYTGSFTLPSDNAKDLDLGKVTFSATHSGVTDTGSSGTIVCEKAQVPVIGEIVSFTAETFDGDKSDDDSRPTNNYLPQGTVDYVVGRAYFGEKEYLKLRCGRRVYVSKVLSPTDTVATVTREYTGKLPDTNRIGVAGVEVTDRATLLTLDTEWKAPFLLDLLPQTYTNPATQDYTVDAVTCEYVQITFCYAAAFTGEITFPADHPLFTHARVTPGDGSYTLRLYLRRTGGFYGWDASYNEKGQLVFYFLHPVQVQEADNAYGADLTGVKILLDVGHGGKDMGAVGLDREHPESERNLNLARLLKKELESLGATVFLNRTADTIINVDERCQLLKELKPDLCIAVHHDSSTSSRPNGFGAFHSTLFSHDVTRYIYEATLAAGIYDANTANNRNRMKWHYYFVARMSDCPVVLTENGFMSSPVDHTGIVSDAVNEQKARAITQGVARYFLSIRLPDVPGSGGAGTTASSSQGVEIPTTTTERPSDTTATATTTVTAVGTTTALPPKEEE